MIGLSTFSSALLDEQPEEKTGGFSGVSNKKAATAVRKRGGSTRTEKAQADTIKSQDQLKGKQQQEQKIRKAETNINIIMDKMGMMPESKLISEEGFKGVQRLLPSVTKDSYFNALVPNAIRRKRATKQLAALPMGTKLPKESLEQLKQMGIKDPQKYMSLVTTLSPPDTILGAFQRASIGQADRKHSPFASFGKQLRGQEESLKKVSEQQLGTAKGSGKGLSSRVETILVDADGNEDPNGTHTGRFRIDPDGTKTLIGIKGASEFTRDRLKKERAVQRTNEAIRREKLGLNFKKDLDVFRTKNRVTAAEISKADAKVQNIRGTEIPKMKASVNAMLPLKKGLNDLFSLIDEIEAEGQIGPVKGRLTAWANQLNPRDPKLARFNTIMSLFTPNIARNIGENKGALSDKDLELIMKGLPALRGTGDYNRAQLEEIENIVNNMTQATELSIVDFEKQATEFDKIIEKRKQEIEDRIPGGVRKSRKSQKFFKIGGLDIEVLGE
jgi:hypothetical protein